MEGQLSKDSNRICTCKLHKEIHKYMSAVRARSEKSITYYKIVRETELYTHKTDVRSKGGSEIDNDHYPTVMITASKRVLVTNNSKRKEVGRGE